VADEVDVAIGIGLAIAGRQGREPAAVGQVLGMINLVSDVAPVAA